MREAILQQTPLHQKEMDSLQKEIANEADGQELDGVGGVIDPLGEHGGSRAVEVDQGHHHLEMQSM